MEIIEYYGRNNIKAKCGIDIVDNVFVLTELQDNMGGSVTNNLEKLIAYISSIYDVSISEIIYVEHYIKDNFFDEHFDVVHLDESDCNGLIPRWEHLDLYTLKILFGDSFNDIVINKKIK
jgi:hypothetical protein